MIPTDPPIEHLCDSKPRASGDDPDHNSDGAANVAWTPREVR